MWGPRGEDEAVIGEEEEAVSDLDSQSLEEIAQNNQGSMDAGKCLSSLRSVGQEKLTAFRCVT